MSDSGFGETKTDPETSVPGAKSVDRVAAPASVPSDDPAPWLDLSTAAAILRDGGIVAFPTETVYGLGADALNERAVARVFEAKGRPFFDPLIVHVDTLEKVEQLVQTMPRAARELALRFWPGPLTLVLPKAAHVPDLVTAGAPTVAVRIPDHPVAQALLRATNRPLAGPSANRFGRLSPTTAEHVRDQLGDAIDGIIDGGPSRVGVESSVVQVTESGTLLLRPGGVPLEDLEAVIGPIVVPAPDQHPGPEYIASPGRLPQHYAPRTPLLVLPTGADLAELTNSQPLRQLLEQARYVPSDVLGSGSVAPRLGLLTLAAAPNLPLGRFEQIEILSTASDLREAAARFFAAFRRLDAAGLQLIVAQPFPEQGLGRALNDRLRRAAAR